MNVLGQVVGVEEGLFLLGVVRVLGRAKADRG